MGAEVAAAITGAASAIAVIVTSLRRRKDVDLDELQQRVSDLTDRLESAEGKIGDLRSQLVTAEGQIFLLRRTIASHGIPDPLDELLGGGAS